MIYFCISWYFYTSEEHLNVKVEDTISEKILGKIMLDGLKLLRRMDRTDGYDKVVQLLSKVSYLTTTVWLYRQQNSLLKLLSYTQQKVDINIDFYMSFDTAEHVRFETNSAVPIGLEIVPSFV